MIKCVFRGEIKTNKNGSQKSVPQVLSLLKKLLACSTVARVD